MDLPVRFEGNQPQTRSPQNWVTEPSERLASAEVAKIDIAATRATRIILIGVPLPGFEPG
jgi:hypothetical protein